MEHPRQSLWFGASRRRLSTALIGGLCVCAATLGAAAGEGFEDRFAVVELPSGDAAAAASELEVLVDGESAPVTGIRALAPSPGGRPWRVLIYFDTPLLTPDGLESAISRLHQVSDQLARLGPVSIVVADPEPRELLTDARHAHEIREALELFGDRTTLAGELLWRRLRHLEAARDAAPDEAMARRELERELALLARQRTALEDSLRSPGGEGPGLLLLVQDGFDLDLGRFYIGRTERLEGLETGVDAAHAELCRNVAEAGWTVLGVALGEQGSELVSPRAPVKQLVDATGGRLVSRGADLDVALAELDRRVRVAFRPPPGTDGSARLEIRLRSRPLPGPRWAGRPGHEGEAARAVVAAESTSSLRLLSPGPAPHVGPTRLTAITGEHEVDYVAFFLDGFLVDVAQRPPFQTRVDLGPEPSVHTVRAVAFSNDALELGEDTLRLNEEDQPFRVDIVEVVGDPSRGQVDLRAEASTPTGRRLERIEVYWNDELRQSFAGPPLGTSFSARLETAPPRPTDHYRVVAYLDDGSSLESARLALERDHAERLDVNLVELYALVSDRRRGAQADLSREDFTLIHGGRTQHIQGFARAQDVPLTLGLAVDVSESMEVWQDDIREAAAAFFESALGDEDRAFLVDFDERGRLTQAPTRRQELLVGRMGALDFGGTTALYDSILFSLTQFEGEGGRKALVVLSDGEDYDSRFRPERCIREALRLGVPIYMVVVEDAGDPLGVVDRLVVNRLARQTGGRAYFFSSRLQLGEIYTAIEADLRSQYLLTYAMERPLTAADLGDIRVEVTDPRLTVRTILGRSVRIR